MQCAPYIRGKNNAECEASTAVGGGTQEIENKQIIEIIQQNWNIIPNQRRSQQIEGQNQ